MSLIEEYELNVCSPINCEFYFNNSCVLGCPAFNCDNCTKERYCKLLKELKKLSKSTHETLVDFIPELKNKEIVDVEAKIQKCLHKRIWLTKNKGYTMFDVESNKPALPGKV